MVTRLGAGVAGAVLVGLVGIPAQAHDRAAAPSRAVGTGLRSERSAGAVVRSATSSQNWAGYARRTAAHEVTAQWRVPRITSTRTDGYSSTWVGIDGLDGHHLTQVGTGQDVVKGRVSTYAWWEVITPTDEAPEQQLPLAVRPGHHVSARVTASHGLTTVSLTDLTTGRSVSRRTAYRGPAASAEWIQEDVDCDDRISPAPAWSPVAFDHVGVNGVPARLRAHEALDIVDAHGVHETTTGLPGPAGDRFIVRRLAAGHWTPMHA